MWSLDFCHHIRILRTLPIYLDVHFYIFDFPAILEVFGCHFLCHTELIQYRLIVGPSKPPCYCHAFYPFGTDLLAALLTTTASFACSA